MSHEIRTPLNAIIGMAQIAQNAQTLDKAKDCLEKMESNSKHLLGIINDILDFSKIESVIRWTVQRELIKVSTDPYFPYTHFFKM